MKILQLDGSLGEWMLVNKKQGQFFCEMKKNVAGQETVS